MAVPQSARVLKAFISPYIIFMNSVFLFLLFLRWLVCTAFLGGPQSRPSLLSLTADPTGTAYLHWMHLVLSSTRTVQRSGTFATCNIEDIRKPFVFAVDKV